ncbi:MAG: hypothetical protein VYD64_04165 [Pseudomonadota bacterium]|nr:hypothetical protein [Pseudomonadota bacterium]
MRSRYQTHLSAAVIMLVVGMALHPENVAAQGPLLESYTAFLGSADHFNSRGARLTEPWQVIRQDRANVHRYGVRDPGDEHDSFFASIRNRDRMEQLILGGYIEPNAGWRIVNENVWVTVDIYQDSVNVSVQ